ncbi:MAG: glycoside hydrolase family 36 protein [Verrucomicrobiota bacterium]|nr:glycoside hydrolase family 36 protein [Verrucomicrobiota bacterium]
MSNPIIFNHAGLNVHIDIAESGDVRLLHCSPLPFDVDSIPEPARGGYRMIELHITGYDQHGHHGSRHTMTNPGMALKYDSHTFSDNKGIRTFLLKLKHENKVAVTLHWDMYAGSPIIRSWLEVTNTHSEMQTLEYAASFVMHGIGRAGLRSWAEKCEVYIPHNTWMAEIQWKRFTLPQLGLNPGLCGVKRFNVVTTGSWSSSGHLPMGLIENKDSGETHFWQIEHNGSWHYEIAEGAGGLYLQLSGPTEHENNWWKHLQPGETFTTVPVAYGCLAGDYHAAFSALTTYRRHMRKPHSDMANMPIIFNDYMNCLYGDPTTEKLIPLIDAAAKVGCEYFVIDCGWYADNWWWVDVGEWLPSAKRFPGGIQEPLDYIRKKGMTPGLWLEIEVVGTNSPLVKQLPDSWFFTRHGKKIIDHGRYQLDFRNPAVREHADKIIARVVGDYGAKYIKMDYNINAGPGTELDADSIGQGLLEHNRAYLLWLDGVLDRYPDLVMENCGSGGLRMDYAMLQRLPIQSTSDQTDYKKYAIIAAAAPSAVTPEQAAVWSYPLRDGTKEEAIFNMVNAMLLRVHQSGHMGEIAEDRLSLVREGLDVYKQIRTYLKDSLPYWPTGLPGFGDGWTSLALSTGSKTFIAVWRLDGANRYQNLNLPFLKGRQVQIKRIYPASTEFKGDVTWNPLTGILTADFLENNTARLFELTV